MILRPKYAVLLWTLAFAASALTATSLSAIFIASALLFVLVSVHIGRHHDYYEAVLHDDSDLFVDEEGGER